KLFAEDGNDILWGGGGSDQYAGGAGRDILYFEGDHARDVAWGGTGRDEFVFQPGFGVDRIKDFLAVGPTSDKIDLSAFKSVTFASLHILQVGKNVEITAAGMGANKIVLEIVNAGAVTRDDFILSASATKPAKSAASGVALASDAHNGGLIGT